MVCFFMLEIILKPCLFVYKFIKSIFNVLINLIKYSYKGLVTTIKVIVSTIKIFLKYTIIGLKYILYVNFIIFKKMFWFLILICNTIYHIFRSIKKGLLIIPRFIKKKLHNYKIKLEEKKKILTPKQIEKNNKKLALLEKKNEKLALIRKKKKEKFVIKNNKRLARQESRNAQNVKNKKNKEVYINDKVKFEKASFSEKMLNFKASIHNFFNGIKDKIVNNSFSKNSRNKLDMKRQALLIDFEGEDAKKSEKKILYQYVARDKNGKVVKDYFEAFSKVEVHSFLLSEGYTVYSIKTSKWIQFLYSGGTVNKTKFKTKDLIFFLTQLSTYVKAGIPLVDALRILSRQYKKKSYQKIFRAIIYELTTGENFSSALLKQNVAFPRLLINMIKTAEMTGELPEVLDDMAEYYTQAEETKKQMVTAMMYPSMVFIFATGVMTFIMVYVVPQFVGIYSSMDGVAIPTITQVILAISHFLRTYYILLIVGIIAFVSINILLFKKVKLFKAIVQIVLMRLPVFGKTIIYNEVTMFTKTFSSLLAHNVPITDCMDILNKITNNEIYKMLIFDTINNLAKGGKISDAFKGHWAFPIPAYEMIVTGEMTGELSDMMYKVSNYYQGLHKESVTRIKTFIEPALTVFLAGGVGIIILSIIIPMFGMYSAVNEMG